MHTRTHGTLGGLLIFALVSCSGPSVQILNQPVESTRTIRAIVSSTSLDKKNRHTLRNENLLNTYNHNPQAALKELANRFKNEPTRERQLALAEMSSDFADKQSSEKPLKALGSYLDAAWLTYKEASTALDQGVETPERTIYAYSSARITRLIRDQEGTRGRTRIAPGSMKDWKITLGSGEGAVDPRAFDIVVPASWLKTDGIKWKSITQEGVGVPMVGYRESTPERKAEDPLFPVAGRGFPLNARVDFNGNAATLVLQNLMKKSTAIIGGKKRPLAANFSLAIAFSYYDDVRRMNRIEALLRPSDYQDLKGLYSLEPYDPEKIPLVLVHGLMSRAEAWYPFVNLLLADPVVRERYQILFFNYPTGMPIMQSAADLREALSDFQTRNDPHRSNSFMRRMVIAGHSMGGVISNAQIRDSGERIREAYFTKEIDNIDFSKDQKIKIKRAAEFEANEDIERAILLAAPLRGSKFAKSSIGNFGAKLIRLPFDMVDSLLGRVEVIDALTDVAQEVSQRPPSSVSSLRPDNPFLEAVLECPVREGVEIHNVMGQLNFWKPKEEGTDGFVTYTSAQLDDSTSELIVMKSNHRAMVERDETVQEVWRILHLHAQN